VEVILRTAPSSPIFGLIGLNGRRHRGGGDFKCRARVEANSQTYEVELDMIDAYAQDMLGFFEDMGRYRRGWSGVMSWQSEFAEMNLDVRNPGGGEATVEVSMRCRRTTRMSGQVRWW
jgi:hypothetical protein